MKFNLIGDIVGTSGYTVHTRELFKALSRIADVKLSCSVPQGFITELTDRELDSIKKKDSPDRINLLITNPSVWSLYLTKERNIVYLIWEGDRVPIWIIELCKDKRIEKIIVASNHTKDAIKDKEVLNKVFIANHGVDTDLFYSKDKPIKTTFLINKGWRNLEDRGGTQYALRAYFEEFTDKDDVELILKVNPAYGIPNIDKMMREIAPRQTNLPKIFLDVNSYPYNKLVDLYNKANVFLMTTRAEAFGLPCAEASACGVMSLVTGFGGQIDIIKDKINGFHIDYDLVEIKHEILYEGCRWSVPKIKDIREKMRWCYNNPKEVINMGIKANEIAKEFTWDMTAKTIIKNIEKDI